jgi:hypothetical protein
MKSDKHITLLLLSLVVMRQLLASKVTVSVMHTDIRSDTQHGSTAVPSYPWVICSKTYRGYVKPWIMPNAIYNVIFM